ncbi:MAG: hypothetical protein GX952_00705 [Firmicutes bacterium]|nr:hypothetical protein [Bacillota bacterium]
MKRVLPQALLYKEWKSARWGLAGLTLVLVLSRLVRVQLELKWLIELAQAGNLTVAHHSYWFQTLLFSAGAVAPTLVTVAGLAFLLFYPDRQGATASFLNSMPFTKMQLFDVKWAVGAGVITGAYLIHGVLLSAFYFLNRPWMFSTPYRAIPIWSSLQLLVSLAAFSFFLFVHSAMGHSLAAAVVGPICSFVPAFMAFGLRDIIYLNFSLSYDNALIVGLSKAANILYWPYLVAPSYLADARGEVMYPEFDQLGVRLLVLGIIMLVSFFLGRALYRRNSVEKVGELLMFSQLEPVLIYGFAICFGLLFNQIFGLGYGSGAAMINTFFLGGFMGGFFLARKVVYYYRQ